MTTNVELETAYVVQEWRETRRVQPYLSGPTISDGKWVSCWGEFKVEESARHALASVRSEHPERTTRLVKVTTQREVVEV